jgi:F-type H+-transporting ATPase subunit b
MVLAESSIQLVPDGTLLLHLLMVAVMVALLNRTLLKPVNKILADREEQIQGRISEANKIKQDADQKLQDYNAALRNARSEAYSLLERERAAALQEKDAKVRLAKDEITRATNATLGQLHQQENTVKSELETQAASISDLISSQILHRRP